MDVSATHAAKLSTTEETLYSLLVENGVSETRPKRVNGEIVYEGLEDLTIEVGGDEVIRQLKSLHEKGILKEDSIDFALFCPHCGSLHVQSRYNCPRCQSLNVNRVEVDTRPSIINS